MRTTLTLDEDVTAMLKKVQKQSSTSFKETVNSLLRAGLKESLKPAKISPFKTRVHNGGKLLIDPSAKIQDILDEIEGPRRK